MTSIVVGLIGILVAILSGGAMYRGGRISRRGYYGLIGIMTLVFLVILALVIYNSHHP